jgi:hypothetical protein
MADNRPIDAEFDEVARKKATPKPQTTKSASTGAARQSPARIQVPLDVGIHVEGTIGGIEMGVLQNGISYLTPTGLEEVAGVAPAIVSEVSQEWKAAVTSGVVPRLSRIAFFHEYLSENGYSDTHLNIQIFRNGSPYHVYPDIVCIAFLEYFAFESLKKSARAVQYYRSFARTGFQEFVYKALGYAPRDHWKYLHDRISSVNGSAPESYFSVFSEVSGIVIDLIYANLSVSDEIIPDSGVDKSWGDHWNTSYFDDVYGARIRYEQSDAANRSQTTGNPQQAWAYPNEALAEFRRWFRHEYLTTRFPRYILTRTRLLSKAEKPKRIGTLRQSKPTQRGSA